MWLRINGAADWSWQVFCVKSAPRLLDSSFEEPNSSIRPFKHSDTTIDLGFATMDSSRELQSLPPTTNSPPSWLTPVKEAYILGATQKESELNSTGSQKKEQFRGFNTTISHSDGSESSTCKAGRATIPSSVPSAHSRSRAQRNTKLYPGRGETQSDGVQSPATGEYPSFTKMTLPSLSHRP